MTTQATEQMPIKAFLLAIVMGLLGATASTAFLWIIEEGQHTWFVRIPEVFGWSGTPAWWVMFGLLIGAGLIICAKRLKGGTGKGPLTGFHFDNPVSWAPAILIAALATLWFGASLGPEGPLIVLGTVIGGLLMRRAEPTVMQLAMFLGGIAAIGAILGNPFVTAFMVLEFAAMGMAPVAILLPTFVALGAGYITQVGWGAWTGFGTHALAVPGLPAYDTILPFDLLMGLLVAIGVAIVTAVARELAERIDLMSQRRPNFVVLVASILTGLAAIVVVEVFDVDYSLVLFSGQTGMTGILAQTSILAVVCILAAKLFVYALALGGGFRGGPIFPATYIGVTVGVLATLAVSKASLGPMAAVGIAAAATVMLRLPFTSALMAMLLVGSVGAAIAPFAILGAVVGFIVRAGLDRFDDKRQAGIDVKGEVVNRS